MDSNSVPQHNPLRSGLAAGLPQVLLSVLAGLALLASLTMTQPDVQNAPSLGPAGIASAEQPVTDAAPELDLSDAERVSWSRPSYPPGYGFWAWERDYAHCVATGAFYFMVWRNLRGAAVPPWIGQSARNACLRYIHW